MISQYDDLTGKEDVQNFLKMLKEKNIDEGKYENMLKRMSPTGKKVDNFLGGQTMAMHDYQKDPELIKTLQEIINVPGYDPDSVREAQRQMLRIRQGLPRFPTA